jgi:RNA polymerase sigma factor (sigma-70 family)
MRVENPLADESPTDREDHSLVVRARLGDRKALEDLIRRHQPWIYNIALRMLYHPQDAEDATQEILVKTLTRLSSFEGRSSFRTWLYRIVVNHVLNMRRGRVEGAAISFNRYAEDLDNTPQLDLPDPNGTSVDTRQLVTEAMLSCTSGMLLCLDRNQRLAYILGAIFGVTDTVAAEVLEITTENFRQRLARARRDLHNFMHEKCGRVNRANPCRCAGKTRGFIEAGYVDPNNCSSASGSARFATHRRRPMRPLLGWTQDVQIYTEDSLLRAARLRADAASFDRESRSDARKPTRRETREGDLCWQPMLRSVHAVR